MHHNDSALFQLIDGAGALVSLTKMLQNGHHWKIQECSAELINLLAVRKDAKIILVNESTVVHLLELLQQSRVANYNAALSALGNITIANEGELDSRKQVACSWKSQGKKCSALGFQVRGLY